MSLPISIPLPIPIEHNWSEHLLFWSAEIETLTFLWERVHFFLYFGIEPEARKYHLCTVYVMMLYIVDFEKYRRKKSLWTIVRRDLNWESVRACARVCLSVRFRQRWWWRKISKDLSVFGIACCARSIHVWYRIVCVPIISSFTQCIPINIWTFSKTFACLSSRKILIKKVKYTPVNTWLSI